MDSILKGEKSQNFAVPVLRHAKTACEKKPTGGGKLSMHRGAGKEPNGGEKKKENGDRARDASGLMGLEGGRGEGLRKCHASLDRNNKPGGRGSRR